MTVDNLSGTDWLGPLESAATVIKRLAPDIYILSSVATLIFAAVILISLQRRAEKASDWGKSPDLWAKLFAAAIALWSIQYGMRYAVAIATEHQWVTDSPQTLRLVTSVVVYGSSSVNNLLFLAAARALKRRKILFPAWALLAASVSLVAIFDYAGAGWYESFLLYLVRFPDVLFSAYCIFVLGMAIANNIALHSSRSTGWTVAGASIVYGVLHLIYAFSLLITEYYRLLVEPFLFVLALPLKFVLFFSAYFLLLRNMTTFESLQGTLRQVTHGRHEFLSQNGIVRPVGIKIGADKVDLSIRLPGRRHERIASFKWERNEEEKSRRPAMSLDEEVKKIPLDEADVVVQDCFHHRLKGDVEFSPPKFIAMPIFFHGAVIGCLKVERVGGFFSAAVVHQVSEIAGLMSPALQAFRELAALDRLSIRLANRSAKITGLEDTHDAAALGGPAKRRRRVPALRPPEFVRYVADTINDTLSLNVSRLFIKFGFESLDPEFALSENSQRMREEFKSRIGTREFNNPPEVFAEGFYYDLVHYDALGIQLRKKERGSANDKSPKEGYLVGDFVFAVPSETPDIYPALGTRFLHRNVVATIVVDAYLDFMRGYFEKLLNKFSRRLNREIIQQSKWVRNVQWHARQAGLLWAVAARRGSPAIITLRPMPGVGELVSELRKGGDPDQLQQHPCDEIKARLSGDDPVVTATNHVIGIPLRNSDHCLWFGVGRRGFGDELAFMSPWKNFLENFATIADAALERYARASNFQRLQINAARANELAAVAATTGTVIHRLTNMVRDQRTAAAVLIDGMKVGRLRADAEYTKIINAMEHGAGEQLSLLGDLLQHTEVDGQRPSNLFNAAKQATHLFSTSLRQGGIKLENKVPRELHVDVPFYVPLLALSNLISNAKDAIARAEREGQPGGTITISAEANGDYTLCHVTDDGAGIPHHLRDRVFEVGATSKGQSGGWGLFLVHHSLKEHGSLIYVERTGGEGTTFTIRFPNPR